MLSSLSLVRLSDMVRGSKKKFEGHRVDSNIPIEPIEKLPTFGSYCIKAKSSLRRDDDTITFEGYLPDLKIADIVEYKCKMHEKDGKKCTPVEMCFLGPIRECNKVTLKDTEGKQLNEWYLM